MSRAGLLAVTLAFVAICTPGRSAGLPLFVFPTSLTPPPTPNDPFPIRRLFLPPNRVPEGLGTLVRMPRDEFEQKVRAASDAQRRPPRIAAAQYTAILVDGALVGTAEWTIRNPSGRNGLLALDPHRLALTRTRWADGSTARLIRIASGDEAPKTFAWLDGANAVDGSRLQTEWSVRASGEPGDSRFELRMPPAGIATLILTLPKNLMPRVTADDSLLTGPTPADDPARQRWRIAFGGRSAIDLVLTANDQNRIAQPGLVKTSIRLAIGEGRAEGTYRFELDPAHEPGDAYFLDFDDRVTVQAVVADVPIDWQSEPRQTGSPSSIRIVPREAGRIGRLNVTVAVNPPVPDLPWLVPKITLRHAFPAETAIQLRIASDLRPVKLDSGDFRLSEADRAESVRTYSWTSTFARANSIKRQWPSLAFAVPGSDVSVSERATFAVGTTDCFLRVTATVAVQRGPVSTLSFSVPEPYRTAVAPSVPGDPMATVRLDESKPARWIVSLSRPLATGQSTSVNFSLSAPFPAMQNGAVRIGIPAVTWSAASRSGSVTVSASPEWTLLSPLVVAYQDLPPDADLFLRKSVIVAPGEHSTPQPLSPSIGTIVDVRPEHAEATIGDRSTAILFTGVTGRPGDLARVSLPTGSIVRAVRLGDRTIDHPHFESDDVILPACISEAMPFEIQVEWARSGSLAERIRVAWPDDHTIPIRWKGQSNWIVGAWGNGDSAIAIRRELIVGAGWILAACLLVPLIEVVCAGPSCRRSLIVLFIAAVLCGCIVTGSQAGSVFVPPLVVSLVGLLFALLRRVPTAAVVAVLFAMPVDAAAPQPVDVYLVYGTGEDANRLFVYAPKSLLDRLDRLAGTAEPDVAILSARYVGSERADEATIRAEWTVHVPPGGPHRLNVPLSGVKLESVSVDGSPAFPEPLPFGGISLVLPNRGTHIISATFAVPIRAVGREREIRFSGPDVASATFEFTSKNATSRVDVISRRGKQSTTIREGNSVTNADLGEGRVIAIRWQEKNTKPIVPTTDTTLEAAVWDVDESETTLTAAIQFPANYGSDFRIHVPAGLSLVRVIARPGDGSSPLPIEIQRNGETMTAIPRQPVENKFTVVLTFVPDTPITAKSRFTLPRAVDRPDPSAVYAIRLNGLVATEFGRVGVIDVPADAAARAATPFPELSLDARPATRAYRRTGENVELSPILSLPSADVRWNQTLTWTLGSRADLQAEWHAAGPLPAIVSFGMPQALTLVGVRGPDVIDATSAEGRHTIWLRTDDDPATIRITGTLGPLPIGEWSLPVVRPPDVEKTIVRIRPATGYAVRVQAVTGMTPLADGAYELARAIDSLNVTVTTVEPPKPTTLPAVTSPVTPPPAVTPSVASPAPAIASRSPRTNVLIWLAGMALLGIAFAKTLHAIRPELILAGSVLAWIAWSPLAAIGVILGVALRIIRSLRETPSPAR